MPLNHLWKVIADPGYIFGAQFFSLAEEIYMEEGLSSKRGQKFD